MLRDELLRPLTARSVLLSTLLGVHPPELPPSVLVAMAGEFGISAATTRVALTRMVSAGDLVRHAGGYRLNERLVRRQRRQDDAVAPATRAWRDRWEVAVVTAVGRAAGERALLRGALRDLRMAELREGLWLRPANLRRGWPTEVSAHTDRMIARPDEDGARLAARLWDLDGWARTGQRLHRLHERASTPAELFTTAAAVVRHLLDDPVLPDALLPTRWPAEMLRADYARYRAELMSHMHGTG